MHTPLRGRGRPLSRVRPFKQVSGDLRAPGRGCCPPSPTLLVLRLGEAVSYYLIKRCVNAAY